MRTLVIGESHYCWDGYGYREESRNVVRNCIDRGPGNKFWRQVTIGFIGHSPDLAESRDLWESLAFYEFIQDPMASRNHRPSSMQWARAAAPFLQVLEDLRPDLVAVYGLKVWKSLPTEGRKGEPIFAGTTSAQTRVIPIGHEHECLVVSFKHPSAGFGGYKHHPIVRAAIEVVANRISRTRI